jgi:type II secretory pathway component PulF
MSVPSASSLPPASAQIDALKLRVAAKAASARWRRSIDRLADEIQAGKSWEEATAGPGWRPDANLRALVETALSSGHPADLTLNLLQRHAATMSSWRELLTALTYPSALLVVSLLVATATGSLMMQVCAQDVGWNTDKKHLLIVEDFQDMAIATSITLVWSLAILLTVRLLGTSSLWLRMVGSLPVIGRPYRWLALSDLLSRLAVISQVQPALPQALRTTGRSYGDAALTALADRVAMRVEQGMTLQHALHKTILSDDRAGVTLTLIEMDETQYAPSIDRASRLLSQMACLTCDRLKLVLPLFILFIVASLIWAAWSCYVVVFALLNQALV